MNELLHNLIDALREELKQYGEMLAQLDQQQEMVMMRQTQDMLGSVAGINAQAETIQAARHERALRHLHLARALGLPEETGLLEMIPSLPADYQPLVTALVQENNELLVRVQQRARQNQMLLGRVVELMQRFISALFPGQSPSTYNDAGRLLSANAIPQSLYNAVG